MNEPFINDLIRRRPELKPCVPAIQAAAKMLITSVQVGGRILLCGNGGSAADCSHIAGELLKSLARPRALNSSERGLFVGPEAQAIAERLHGAIPAISLPDQGAIHSAWHNDEDGQYGFAQLTWGLGRSGDVLWGISTSGNSPNVMHAVRTAQAKGIKTLGLLGRGGGKIAPLCDVAIIAPGVNTQEVQEAHLPIYHVLCLMLEAAIFP